MLNGSINFFVLLCRVIHIVSAVGWLGGVAFLNGVADPIFNHLGAKTDDVRLRLRQRFTGYVWSCVWGLGVSGVVLMLYNGQFIWFDYSTMWRTVLLSKQILFIVMVLAALVISRSVKDSPSASHKKSGEFTLSPFETIEWRINLLNKFTMTCGIVALILAAAM